MRSWGDGHDQVIVGWGEEMLEASSFEAEKFPPADWPEAQIVMKDGVRRVVVPIGDPPLGSIVVQFVVDDCPYSLWLSGEGDDGEPQGYTLEEAVEYSRRF
jgi:hypothetical protein